MRALLSSIGAADCIYTQQLKWVSARLRCLKLSNTNLVIVDCLNIFDHHDLDLFLLLSVQFNMFIQGVCDIPEQRL